jgi:hypothetical protein
MDLQTVTDQPEKDRHPLVTLGVITAGSQLGAALINRLARHPVLLFSMGIGVGIYSYKNRKQILAEVEQLTDQGKKLFTHNNDD